MTGALKHAREAGKSREKRDIVSDAIKRWPNGLIPYTKNSTLSKCPVAFYVMRNKMMTRDIMGFSNDCRKVITQLLWFFFRFLSGFAKW